MEAVAKRAACVVMIRPADPAMAPDTLQVYLVRRADTLAFLGGFYAFPGGRVDAVDAQPLWRTAPEDGDVRSAALRELFEETGVLAVPGSAHLPATAQQSLRRTLEHTPAAWPQQLRDWRLSLDASVLLPCGRWRTPPFSPVVFDAQYYVLRQDVACNPEIWPGELTHGVWLTPQQAIAQHESGLLCITYPVLETLLVLMTHAHDVDAAAAALQGRGANAYPVAGGEMAAGIHMVPLQTPTLPPATHTNCYILGRRDLVVVDPGPVDAAEQTRLLDYLTLLQGRGGTVRQIWLTHFHHDHVGAAVRLRDALKVPIAAHADTAKLLAGQVPVDTLLADGQVLPVTGGGYNAAWTALHTPGHAHGHLCFHDAQRGHVLCGDNILGMGSSIVPPRPDGSMRDYMASLQRLLPLKLGMLFPGHGPPMAAAAKKIQQYLTHRLTREAAIVQALTQPLTVPQIVASVYTDVAPALHMLAQATVRAHLEKLQADGQVTQQAERYVRS